MISTEMYNEIGTNDWYKITDTQKETNPFRAGDPTELISKKSLDTGLF